jgi:hypothetical protein
MKLYVVAGLAGFALAAVIAASEQAGVTVIGILEDNPGHYAGDPHYRDVRVVFRRETTGWVAFPSNCPDESCLRRIAAEFPAQGRWTISLEGQDVGHVVSKTPSSFKFYSTVGQQEIIDSAPPPTIGKPSTEFGGFVHEAVYRPLVAVSEPNYRDPEKWQPAKISSETLAALRNAFRNRFPKIENCTNRNINHAKPWAYADANVTVNKAYASNRRWLIAELQVSGYQCDGPPDEAFFSQWFVVSPEQQARFLDSGVWLVDAGDYDNDGSSELVFSIDGDNRGGYKLFYDDFKRKAVFEFSYH